MRAFGSVRAAVVAAGVLLGFSGQADAALKTYACVPEWAALLKALGGDAIEVTSLTTPLDNPESMHPTPAMISDLQQADLLVCTGAGLEGEWLPSLLDRVANPALAVGQPGLFFAAQAVTLLQDQTAHETGEGHLHGEGNPHIQGDPRNVIKVAGQLARRLSDLDPDNAQLYGDNARAFIRELGAVAKELEAEAAPLKGANVVVQHESSLYLLSWLGIHADGTIEMEEGVPPGPAHLAQLIDKIPRDAVKFVIYSPFDDPGAAQFVTEKAGIPLVMWPFTIGGTAEAVDFPSFYRDAVARLLDGLNGTSRR